MAKFYNEQEYGVTLNEFKNTKNVSRAFAPHYLKISQLVDLYMHLHLLLIFISQRVSLRLQDRIHLFRFVTRHHIEFDNAIQGIDFADVELIFLGPLIRGEFLDEGSRW